METNELRLLYDYIMQEKFKEANIIVDKSKQNKATIFRNLKLYYRNYHSDDRKFEVNYKMFLSHECEYFKYSYDLIKKYMKDKSIDINKNFEMQIIYLKKFKHCFPSYQTVVDEILSLLYEKVNFMDFSKSFATNYEREFYHLLKIKNPVSLYKKFNWSPKVFYYKLNLFKTKYTSDKDVEYARYLEKQYLAYLNKYKANEIKENITRKELGPNELLNDLFASHCSIYEYCDKHLEYNVSNITKAIKMFYKPGEVQSINERLELLESANFQSKIDNIALQIVTNPKFTILDYYLATKLSLFDFKSRIKYFNNELSKFISYNSARNFNYSDVHYSHFSKEKELETKRVIQGIEITEQDKLDIFNYLENNEIPVDRFTYRACINKLLDGTLDFEQKNKHLKGSF